MLESTVASTVALTNPFVWNPHARRLPVVPGRFTTEELRAVIDFFEAYPGYSPTPLYRLPTLARRLGIKELLIKDESQRLGVNAFKILGSTYAMHFLRDTGELRGGSVLACATDGNHGRAVSKVGRQMGFPVQVYMHADATPARVQAIRTEGAEVTIVNGNYDTAIRRMAEDAKKNGWIVISDTAWPGYEVVPHLIMAGYTVLMKEAAEQCGAPPDLVVVQAGCGGLVCAVVSWYLHELGKSRPLIVSCEAHNSACVLESIRAGRRIDVGGDLKTIMAGLSCGVVSSVAWPTLHAELDACISISDDRCIEAMRRLVQPEAGDPVIVGGESGASGVAALAAIMEQKAFAAQLHLGPESRVLVINTEGATDPASFHSITQVWPD